jgi:hypothetical protein
MLPFMIVAMSLQERISRSTPAGGDTGDGSPPLNPTVWHPSGASEARGVGAKKQPPMAGSPRALGLSKMA